MIVPAFRRTDQLLDTLRKIQGCCPLPAEILVHVDGGDPSLVSAVTSLDPAIRLLTSSELQGPGGSRNKLIAEATHELVANFDDDSHPVQDDYFARVMHLADHFPDAAMFSAASHEQEWISMQFQRIAQPSGCGCVFRKSWFVRTTGFVPLPIAYGMEEVDIGLQLHEIGGVIVHDPLLRVVHNHAVSLSVDADTNAHILANTALLVYLRYPAWLWPLGAWSVVHRVSLLLMWGWTAGLLRGLQMLPEHFRRYGAYRRSIYGLRLLSWLALRRWPNNLGDAQKLGQP